MTRKLPPIVKKIRFGKLRKQLLTEEVFDCIKDSIRNTTVRDKSSVTRGKRKKRNRKARRIYKRVTYAKYILSDAWKNRRNRFFQKYGRQCAVCGSCEFVQLHHMVYGEYGQEKDEHLVPLCKVHHDEFHADRKTTSDMVRETLEFIREKKDELDINWIE